MSQSQGGGDTKTEEGHSSISTALADLVLQDHKAEETTSVSTEDVSSPSKDRRRGSISSVRSAVGVGAWEADDQNVVSATSSPGLPAMLISSPVPQGNK